MSDLSERVCVVDTVTAEFDSVVVFAMKHADSMPACKDLAHLVKNPLSSDAADGKERFHAAFAAARDAMTQVEADVQEFINGEPTLDDLKKKNDSDDGFDEDNTDKPQTKEIVTASNDSSEQKAEDESTLDEEKTLEDKTSNPLVVVEEELAEERLVEEELAAEKSTENLLKRTAAVATDTSEEEQMPKQISKKSRIGKVVDSSKSSTENEQ